MQNAFSTLKVLNCNLANVFHFTEKNVGFFIKAKCNSNVTRFETKCVVMCRGNNNGNQGYCGQRLR